MPDLNSKLQITNYKQTPSSKNSNSKLLFFVILILFGICFLRFGALAKAQIPPHNPTPIPCSDTGDPEFHSLRPYQASPCEVTHNDYATFCGNTLTLQDKIDVTYKPGVDNCTPIAGGKVRCSYVIPISRTITIDLSGAKLPIMGNTENVPNSQPPTGTPLTDAEKVNGYVSWYLNGIMNRAEDGSLKTADSITPDYNVINLSGPLNKLLPGAILDAQRIKTIENVAANLNHDQIAVCAHSSLGVFGDITGLGTFTPRECYPQGNGSTATMPVFRLNRSGCIESECDGWDGELSWWNKWVEKMIDHLTVFFPGKTRDWIRDAIGKPWNKRTPPLPWADENGKPFATEDLYTKAYYEWRGNTCVLIPVINKVVCFNNILVPDKYADLYPYIPLSSTEDVEGNIKVDSVSVGGPGITNVSFDNQTPAKLFFPHLTESDQLGSSLQDTYIAKSEAKTGPDTAVAPASSCNVLEVRSNPGDNLFATSLSGNLKYTASFSCTFDAPTPSPSCSVEGGSCMDPKYCCPGYDCNSQNICRKSATSPPCSGTCLPSQAECKDAGGTGGIGTCTGNRYCCKLPPPVQKCSVTVSIALSTSSNTPKINDIWSRLVAGPTAVVKRMFPKLGTQIGTLKDIPGSTAITYSGAQASSAELNFPHVGGISEYFLKGIQTLLRPKGYGEQITFGGIHNNIVCGKLPDLPKGSGSCSLGSVSSRVGTIPQSLKDIIVAAAETYKVPPNLLLGIMFGESAFEGAYEWTDENVKNWASCEPFPGCDSASDVTKNVVSFATNEWKSTISDGIRKDLQALDPNKKDPDGCNLLDAIYGLAWLSGDNVDGGAFALPKCFGVSLNTNGSTTNGCDWKNNDYETVIKIWESGTTNMCFTKENSCATGGGSAATCPTGGDTCETVSNRYSKPSHNGCVWDIAHSH